MSLSDGERYFHTVLDTEIDLPLVIVSGKVDVHLPRHGKYRYKINWSAEHHI